MKGFRMSGRIFSGIAALIGIALHASHVAAQQTDSLRAFYRVPPSQLAIPDPATDETLGYPAVSADKRAAVRMLRERKFAELDQYLTGLQDAARKRIQLEYDLVDATRAFATADSTMELLLTEWIAALP